eukprot:COSAG02_NODE_2003_length_10135_cov_9.873754_1_plen_65_part_10
MLCALRTKTTVDHWAEFPDNLHACGRPVSERSPTTSSRSAVTTIAGGQQEHTDPVLNTTTTNTHT